MQRPLGCEHDVHAVTGYYVGLLRSSCKLAVQKLPTSCMLRCAAEPMKAIKNHIVQVALLHVSHMHALYHQRFILLLGAQTKCSAWLGSERGRLKCCGL